MEGRAHRVDFCVVGGCRADVAICLELARDGEGARAQWERDWMTAEDRYVAEHRPDKRADLVVDGVTFLPS